MRFEVSLLSIYHRNRRLVSVIKERLLKEDFESGIMTTNRLRFIAISYRLKLLLMDWSLLIELLMKMKS